MVLMLIVIGSCASCGAAHTQRQRVEQRISLMMALHDNAANDGCDDIGVQDARSFQLLRGVVSRARPFSCLQRMQVRSCCVVPCMKHQAVCASAHHLLYNTSSSHQHMSPLTLSLP